MRCSHDKMPEHSAKILLVDDDALVRRATHRILFRAGFDVHALDAGTAALAWLDEEKYEADLVVTDITMPEPDGIEVARRAREANPNLKVLFMSGWHDDRLALDEAVIRKPFRPAELLDRVRELLGSSPAES